MSRPDSPPSSRRPTTLWAMASLLLALSVWVFAPPTARAAPAAEAATAAPHCELDRPMRFGGMNWESNLVLVEVERFIVEHGYGCKTESLPTETLPALAALARGDLDINSELWLNSTLEPWEKAQAAGTVKRIGDLYMGQEAWFIPKYTAERLPDLKRAADLPRHWKNFRDPEEPSKGRFYGCPAGWGCEVVSENLFRALDLGKTFTLFSPGTGATQKAAIMAAYQRKEDIVFYYWYPTALVGSLDLVRLELPAYDPVKQKCLTNVDCEHPQATDYPANPVFTAVSKPFYESAPELIAFLSKVKMPVAVMNATLAHMEAEEEDPEPMARWFLTHHAEVWTQWVPEAVAQRVQAAL